MVDYVEYPTDTLVKIVIPQQGEQEPPFVPGGDMPGPCGQYYCLAHLPERRPDFFVLTAGGLYFLRPGFDADGTRHVIWHETGRLTPITDPTEGLKPYNWDEISDYLWQQPASWTVSIGVSSLVVFEVALNVYRNRDPTTFNPCLENPDYLSICSGGGIATVEVLPQLPFELNGPPMVYVTNSGECSVAPALIFIQAHCKEETENTLPPVVAPHPPKIIDRGLPTGNSWFLTNTNPAG